MRSGSADFTIGWSAYVWRPLGAVTRSRPAREAELPEQSFGDQLNHLIDVAHRSGHSPYSNKELAEAVRARGVLCTPQYIGQLRAGKHAPSLEIARALAQVFGVPVDYFSDPDVARSTDRQLANLAALADAGVTKVALRAAGLSPSALETLHEIIDRIRAAEGLPADLPDPGQRGEPDDRRPDGS
jgi:transcriptional regulator with XRE-family HTH domain